MNPETRIGRQTPTKSYILPYEMTLGAEAVKVYKRTRKSAMEWQTLILDNIMGQNEEGLWVHSRFGFSVPRRNGKNEVVAMRELWGLKQGEAILHTAKYDPPNLEGRSTREKQKL